jgi:ectoine hydroxylase-related dioxygenase (phytanoyl-CoA dioxygenase family)
MLEGSDEHLDCENMLMQLQLGPDQNGPQTPGWKGATLNYRKIQGLEHDPVYKEYVASPLFRSAVAGVAGAGGREGAAVYRSMFFNKPAAALSGGSFLAWHQDWNGGYNCDRPPLITIYLAIDKATKENGCMRLIPATHTRGVVPPEDLAALAEDDGVPLPLEAGEVVLLSPHLLHSSGMNRTARLAMGRRVIKCRFKSLYTCSTMRYIRP